MDWPLQDNYYPNSSDNVALPSFPEQIPPPAGESDEGDLINVAYALIWQPVLLAAVDQLLLPSTWAGTHDEVILALNRAQMLKDALTIPVEPPTSEVETPYWDDASDVETSEPVDTQVWYGEVTNPTAAPAELDFVENALVWSFTGLIALATPELGFAPAIAFNTIAPKFLIAQKAGDIGEIIRIIVDGQDAASVNTSVMQARSLIRPFWLTRRSHRHQIYIVGTLA